MNKKILLIGFLLVCAIVVVAQQSIKSGGGELTVSRNGQVTIKARSDKTIEFKSPSVYQSASYTGTSSFQPFGIDLNLGAAAGSTDGKFLAPFMGNVFGANMSKAGNYIGGGIFHYNIAGTNATTYPSGAVLAGIGDGTTTAKGAFVAYIDGDSAQTNANAAFKVMHNNSVTGAADGNPVSLGIPAALATADTYQSFQGFVSSANTVTVKRCNLTNAVTALSNPAAATVRATVFKP